LYLNTQINNFIALVSLLVLFHSCSRFDLDDYIFDDLPAKTEAQLQSMADTILTLPRIAELSKRQQVDTFIYYAEWLGNYDEDMALWYAQQAYDLATEENWGIPRGVSANRISKLKGIQAEYGEDIEDAMVDARISRRLLAPYKNGYWEVDINNLFGFLFKRDNELDSARFYFEKAFNKVEYAGVEKQITDLDKAIILQNLATTYPMSDSTSKVSFYLKCDSIYSVLGNKENRARLWLDWGIFYQYHNLFLEADSLFNLCLEYGYNHNDVNLLALAYQEKGFLYSRIFRSERKMEGFNKALRFLNNSLKYENDSEYRTYDIIGNVFQIGWALDIDESYADSAIVYYKQAMEKAREAGAIRTMGVLGNNISFLYNYGGGIHETALGESLSGFLSENYTGVLDTITNNARTAFQRINKVEQREIQVSAANQRRSQLWVSIIIVLVLVMTFVYNLQRQQNKRLKAEMEALRAQINPHFISNSLNAIESLVNLGNTKAASKYLVHFSRLSRQILTGSRASMTSLSSELKTLDHFLALEQLRFRDKLTYKIKLDDSINGDQVEVPAMILQPYAENSIWHGIKPKPDGGHVQVDVKKRGKSIDLHHRR
jgi:tetratricopeptide (TPR) repeat protein